MPLAQRSHPVFQALRPPLLRLQASRLLGALLLPPLPAAREQGKQATGEEDLGSPGLTADFERRGLNVNQAAAVSGMYRTVQARPSASPNLVQPLLVAALHGGAVEDLEGARLQLLVLGGLLGRKRESTFGDCRCTLLQALA